MLKELEAVFGADLPFEDGREVRPPYDRARSYSEEGDIIAEICGKAWEELSSDFLRSSAMDIVLLSSSVFRYLLPAFLKEMLREYEESNPIPYFLMSLFDVGDLDRATEALEDIDLKELEFFRDVVRWCERWHSNDFDRDEPVLAKMVIEAAIDSRGPGDEGE